MLDVQVVVRGVGSASEDYLEGVQSRLEQLGADSPAVIFFPLDNELGMKFQIEEEVLGRLLQPEADRVAA